MKLNEYIQYIHVTESKNLFMHLPGFTKKAKSVKIKRTRDVIKEIL